MAACAAVPWFGFNSTPAASPPPVATAMVQEVKPWTPEQRRAAQLEELVERAERQAERRRARLARRRARWQRRLEACIESLLARQDQAWRPLSRDEARVQCETLLQEKDEQLRARIAIADDQVARHLAWQAESLSLEVV